VGFLRERARAFRELWEEPAKGGSGSEEEFREGLRGFTVRPWWSFANYAQGSQRDVDVRSGVSGRNAGFLRSDLGHFGNYGNIRPRGGEEAMREFRELWKSRRGEGAESMREFRKGLRSFAVRPWWSFAPYAQGSQREAEVRSGGCA